MLPLTTPFKSIALSLSGGGFRAAAFSLGILSYLDKLKVTGDEKSASLLDHVDFISSASGGTITSMLYSMYRSKGKSFDECYKFLLSKMKGEELLDAVLKKLNDDGEWEPPGIGKRRNFINAFAKVYDEQLFLSETFETFWHQQDDNKISVCFNSTDFYRGLWFRFQTDGSSKTFEYVGNRYLHFNDGNAYYKKIKLADILAASSCFPAGFEPIVFPEDFTHLSLPPDELVNSMMLESYDGSREILKDPVGLMDGGITDNQGLYSAMLADKRKRSGNKNGFDLILVGDVTSYFMDPYKPPAEQLPNSWRGDTINGLLSKISNIFKKIKTGLTVSIMGTLVAVTAIVVNMLWFDLPILNTVCLVLTGFGLAFVLVLGLVWRFKSKQRFLNKLFKGSVTPEIKNILESLNVSNNFSEGIIDKLTHYLGNTKLNVLEQMVKARAASVLTMTMDVNLKHTRRLIYELFFENEKWDDRRVYNVAFELSEYNTANRWHRITNGLDWSATDDDKAILKDVTRQMRKIAEDARTMGTTLWFAEEDVRDEKLKKLVSCGQFTSCMNLIEYVLSIESKVRNNQIQLADAERKRLKIIKDLLFEDWDRFKRNAYFLYESFEMK